MLRGASVTSCHLGPLLRHVRPLLCDTGLCYITQGLCYVTWASVMSHKASDVMRGSVTSFGPLFTSLWALLRHVMWGLCYVTWASATSCEICSLRHTDSLAEGGCSTQAPGHAGFRSCSLRLSSCGSWAQFPGGMCDLCSPTRD